jgi:hypothetical protein
VPEEEPLGSGGKGELVVVTDDSAGDLDVCEKEVGDGTYALRRG